MLRKITSVAALVLVVGGALAAAGCKSNGNATSEQPYGLTGSSQATAPQNDPRYIDSKGHFRPDWVNK